MPSRICIATTVAAMALATSVSAACLPRADIVKTLSDGHAEDLVARGLRGDKNLMEIFSSEGGATWTIIQTFPNGMSCVVAAGQHWLDTYERPAKGIPG